MKPRFAWTCSYQGTVWFECHDDTGTYELELRRAAEPYELAIANGDDCRRDMRASVGLLRTKRTGNPARLFEVSAATLDAFNTWRATEHLAHMARLDAEPDRYGFIPAGDPIRQAPAPAWRGFYVIGSGWKRSDQAPHADDRSEEIAERIRIRDARSLADLAELAGDLADTLDPT